MRENINFNHLECFIVLSKVLSFSKAAQTLQIAQPVVSKQIKLLEDSMGAQIFNRSKKGVTLTRKGAELYQRVAPQYLNICQQVEEFKGLGDSMSGEIHIGSLKEYGQRHLVDIVAEFKQIHPKLTVKVSFLNNRSVIAGLKSGDIDLGIIYEKLIQENINIFPLTSEEFVLVTTPLNGNKKVKNLYEAPFVSYRESDLFLSKLLKSVTGSKKVFQANVEIYCNSHASLKELVLKNNYYAALPLTAVTQELKRKELIRVNSNSLKSPLYLAENNFEYPDMRVTLFKKFILKRLKV